MSIDSCKTYYGLVALFAPSGMFQRSDKLESTSSSLEHTRSCEFLPSESHFSPLGL